MRLLHGEMRTIRCGVLLFLASVPSLLPSSPLSLLLAISGKPGPRPAGAPPSCRLRRHARRCARAGRIRTASDPPDGQQSAQRLVAGCHQHLPGSALTPLPGLSDRQAASHTHHCPDPATWPTALAVMQVPFFCSRGPQPKAKQRRTRHPGYALPFHALPV